MVSIYSRKGNVLDSYSLAGSQSTDFPLPQVTDVNFIRLDETDNEGARAASLSEQTSPPDTEITENEYCYELSTFLPDVSRHDISIELHGSILVIRHERRMPFRNSRLRRLEGTCTLPGVSVRTPDFEYKFLLPDDARIDDVLAGLTDGVLSIFVPRTKPLMHSISADTIGA